MVKTMAPARVWILGLLPFMGSPGCDGGRKNPAEEATFGDGGGAGAAGAAGRLAGSSGAAGTEQQPCGPLDSALADPNADELFGYPHVPVFDLYLPDAAWEALQENAMDEEYTQAEACFEGRGIGTVGLRFKGSYATLYECFDDEGNLICPRLSMKLKFDKYVEKKRFFGLKRLVFNANRYDDTRMKERLTYDLYRSMGIVAPRAAWAVVRVNGTSYGLYGMVEPVDGRFTDDRFPDHPDANLYKEVWPGDTGSDLVSALKTNEDAADVSGFEAFSEAMDTADEEDLLTTLGDHTDLDYWARYMAVDESVLSYDGITYFWTDGDSTHNHNYYFYEDSPNHFTLIPCDVESSFWINPDHQAPHWTVFPDDCSATYEYWDGLAIAPGCNTVFRALNRDHSGWHAAARELLDGPFALDTMLATIDQYVAFIGDEARAEETPTMYGTFDGSVQYLRSTIPELRARLEALIAEEE